MATISWLACLLPLVPPRSLAVSARAPRPEQDGLNSNEDLFAPSCDI